MRQFVILIAAIAFPLAACGTTDSESTDTGGTDTGGTDILWVDIGGTDAGGTDTREIDTGGPVDCQLSDWSEWDACTVECGGGTQTRTRTIVVDAMNGGEACGELTATKECNTEPCVNGYTARVVMYATGAFSQLNAVDWVENNSDGTHVWEEVDRDEWSVYLSDESRGVRTRLDLYTKEVLYTPTGETDEVVLYAITDVVPERINGWAATHLTYESGLAFVQLNATQWVENNATGPHLWEEQRRDEWSVYLWDNGRGVAMQLDFYTMELKYTPAGGDEFVLYTIDEADPDRINGWLMREVSHDRGRFVQTAPLMWTEGTFSFEELDRDEWSSYLYDASRDVSIQLDLYTNQILYTAPGSEEQVLLYQVTGAR